MTRSNLDGLAGFAGTMIGPVIHELVRYEYCEMPVIRIGEEESSSTKYARTCTKCTRVFKTDDAEARHMVNYHGQ